MSAWEDLTEGLGPAGMELLGLGAQDMPVGTDEVREAMNAYRAEVLREAAEKIRNENPDRSSDWSDGVDWSADLIDPEVE